jgi:hypothetical protein
MDVQLPTRTVLELTDLLITVADAPGTTGRRPLRAGVCPRPGRHPHAAGGGAGLAGLLREASDRPGLDPATRAACSRWSGTLAGLLSAPAVPAPLAIAS